MTHVVRLGIRHVLADRQGRARAYQQEAAAWRAIARLRQEDSSTCLYTEGGRFYVHIPLLDEPFPDLLRRRTTQ